MEKEEIEAGDDDENILDPCQGQFHTNTVQRTAIGLEIPPYLIVTSLVRLRNKRLSLVQYVILTRC
jgi:hypothetical protein